MFDINEMSKAAFEPVMFTPLQKAQKDGYINITGAEGKKKIEYITSEKHMENYEDPEEKVRAEFFAELIYKYEYPVNRIKVEVVVPDRLPTDRADIVVFSDDDCKRPYAILYDAKPRRQRKPPIEYSRIPLNFTIIYSPIRVSSK